LGADEQRKDSAEGCRDGSDLINGPVQSEAGGESYDGNEGARDERGFLSKEVHGFS
jgi:hypothetical protein